VKLESTRKKIEKAALEEFYQFGFKNASMRVIAKKADMTVGNLYCYFENKEDMFRSLIDSVRKEILDLVSKIAAPLLLEIDFPEKNLKEVVSLAADYIYKRKKECIILFQGTKGSLFGDFRHKFADKLSQTLKKVIEQIEAETSKKFDVNKEFVIDLLSETYITMVIEILKKNKSKEWIEQVMYDIIRLLHKGVLSFFDK
jgi:AcrR family transcriptional regulator